MEDKMNIFLFGDQTFQIGSELSQMACLCDDPILESFLSRAYQALRCEIAELPESQRQQLPSLPSLPKLLAMPSQGPTHVAINQALTCIYHLASFIRYAKSSNPSYPPQLICQIKIVIAIWSKDHTHVRQTLLQWVYVLARLLQLL